MDDMTRFEDRFEHRIRAFAMSGIRTVDSAAVARVAVGHPRGAGAGRARRWLGFTVDRRALALALALALLVTLLGGALLVGARLLLLPPSHLGDRLAHLAYALDGDIYLADWDGSNPVRIADGDPGACDAFDDIRVSPDGRHMAYRSAWNDTCRGTVYISDQDGHLVASFPGVGWRIAWSPDSTRVATWLVLGGACRKCGPGTIGVYGIDGVRQALLDGSRMCCGDHDPVWSPDGAASILIQDSSETVIELPIDGGAPLTVPADDPRWNGLQDGGVAYSPDGTRVAFVSTDSLVLVAADGTQREELIEVQPGEDLRNPQWSPAGDRITYVVTRDLIVDSDGYHAGQTDDLRLVDPETGIATTVATARGTRGGELALRPLGFSPEGDRYLFEADKNGLPSLWSVNIDGTGARMLVAGADIGGWMTSPSDAPSAP